MLRWVVFGWLARGHVGGWRYRLFWWMFRRRYRGLHGGPPPPEHPNCRCTLVYEPKADNKGTRPAETKGDGDALA